MDKKPTGGVEEGSYIAVLGSPRDDKQLCFEEEPFGEVFFFNET